jgi:phosphate starvation-inducible protein PhoH
MIMLATRIGENSRMVITGDLKQTDIMKEHFEA